jgi:hypothetical protein
MRNHTTPKIYDLAGPAGKTAVLTTGASPVQATYNLNNMPTGKDGDMWYYATAIIVEVRPVVNQPASGGAALNADKLWKIVQSLRVYSPILGELFSHTNTTGAAMGLVQQYFGAGFNQVPVLDQIPAADGNTTPVLKYRIPFAYENLKKPHETSPWVGFFEGGQVEVKIDINTILDGDSTGCTVDSVTVNAWMEMIPCPEAVIHTPCQWRRHANLPGSTKRTTITDMGAPDGLAGVDQTKGVGLGALLYLTNATGMGLGGQANQSASNITQVEIPWRDQTVTDNPESFFEAFFLMMGNGKRSIVPTSDFGGFPYTLAATSSTGALANAQALFFPLVSCGRDQETSKFQTVSGAKDLNFNYTTVPSAGPVILGQYFPTFDQTFIETVLVPRIAPTSKGHLRVKTLNKQRNGVPGVGKLAYTRQKVVA